ncbi:MAG: hypothetical protein G01um101418_830 [Parcubacteria group bacterium Gr01-1014_18]|nr:MAG: hypothetical protein Greene041636_790 [Parcubacteria group bacterium Greene0416_36]TSC80027.1 MAG: hypothetical protein G01um101418_830 [Parcubacteria group bacterium Gr01-1014_18]TSD06621.1 MAG: hypothetical protein Greene07142_760 [Parcubacteria group bacterium Greene0714_2]
MKKTFKQKGISLKTIFLLTFEGAWKYCHCEACRFRQGVAISC